MHPAAARACSYPLCNHQEWSQVVAQSPSTSHLSEQTELLHVRRPLLLERGETVRLPTVVTNQEMKERRDSRAVQCFSANAAALSSHVWQITTWT